MRGEEVAGRGATPGAAGEERRDDSAIRARSKLRADPRFRRQVSHLHALGPRPVGELLIEVAGDERRLSEALDRYAGLGPALVMALDAREWPRPPLRAVA